MPRKSDNIPINDEKFDRRVKLTSEVKRVIRERYTAEGLSLRELARQYGVDKKTIRHIVDDSCYESSKIQSRLRCKAYRDEGRYDRAYLNEQANRHRKYKNELYLKGVIGHESTTSKP